MESRILYTPRMRRKKRGISRRAVFAALGFIAIPGVLSGAVYLLRYPTWQIMEISLSGFERVAPVDIEVKIQDDLRGSLLLFLPRSSYFLFDSAASAEKILKDFPRLESVQISKEFPSKISVVAKEREFWAIYCAGESGRCGYSDRTGFVYEEAPVSTGSLILTVFRDTGGVQIPSQTLPRALVEKFILFSELLKSETKEEVESFILSGGLDDEFRARVRSGFFLYVKRDDDFAGVVKTLKIFLEKEIGEKKRSLEYVDLRFGNKIFYKSR